MLGHWLCCRWPWEALALIGFLLFLRAMVYLSLRFKTKTKVR